MSSSPQIWSDPPSLDEFKDALRKGLGRTIQYIHEHDPAPYLDDIRETYTVDMMYDPQMDVAREMYVVDLAEAAHDIDALISSVTEHLDSLTDEDEMGYQFELAAQLVQTGRKQFIEKMQSNFERCVAAGSFVGGSDLIDVCGLDGLLFVVGRVGGAISEEQQWRITQWVDLAAESTDEVSVLAALEKASKHDWNVREFLALHKELEDEGDESIPTHGQDNLEIPEAYEGLCNLIDRIRVGEVETKADDVGSLWAKQASDEDLARASRDLLECNEPVMLDALFAVVMNEGFRANPLELARAVDGLRQRPHGPMVKKIIRRLSWPLQLTVAPGLRDYALKLLAERGWDDTAIDCLQGNYKPGDNCILEEILFADPPKELDKIHFVCIDIRHVFMETSLPECKKLIEWAYQNTPCAFCRESFVEILIEVGVASDRILNECLFDCSEETRKAAREALGMEDPSAG